MLNILGNLLKLALRNEDKFFNRNLLRLASTLSYSKEVFWRRYIIDRAVQDMPCMLQRNNQHKI